MPKTNIEYYEELLKNLPSSYKKWFDEEERYLKKYIKKGSKVLCVACGDGREINYIVDIAGEIVGIDHDSVAVRHAKINFKGKTNVKIKLEEATKLPFEDNSFGYITCMVSFTNFGKNKIPALKEMKRVLKDNGKIILSAYSEDAMSERMKVYKEMDQKYGKIKKIKKDGTVIFDKSFGDNISEQFSEKQLRGFFNEVELKVEEIKKVGIGYICKLSK